MRNVKTLSKIGLTLGWLLVGTSSGSSLSPLEEISSPIEIAQNQSSDTIPRPNQSTDTIQRTVGTDTDSTSTDSDSSTVTSFSGNFSTAVQAIEGFQASEFSNFLGVELYGQPPSVEEIAALLYEMWQLTGNKAAFTYVVSQSGEIEVLTVYPQAQGVKDSAEIEDFTSRNSVSGISQAEILATARNLRREATDLRQRNYLEPAQQLYQWLIAPIDSQLEAQDIDTLIFSMDFGLRGIPIAALHDGERFLTEKYGTAIVPSFGLTDISYSALQETSVLAMGASVFEELSDLRAVPVELAEVTEDPWQGSIFLNESFTVDNFITQNSQQSFGIVHLATHGEFRAGDLDNSYIQFYDQQLNLSELREITQNLGWRLTTTPPVELLVLSACQTAFGEPNAELGFAGLAVQSGAKSVLASLWSVSDLGTLALMSEFYSNLREYSTKSEALQQTRLAMINGEISFEDGQIRLSNGDLVPIPPELLPELRVTDFSHPFYWSAFTLIGNWN